MSLKNEIEKNTDIAWESLYNRLQQDGLLSNGNGKKLTVTRSSALRWVAAIAILIIGAVSVWMFTGNNAPLENTLVLHNEAGSPTLVTTLEDGSIVYLSDHTSIHYPEHFAHNTRKIALKGNAFFEITKQAERPFIIETQTAIIEVLGTSFNVKSSDENAFSLAVRHGKVKVTSRITGESVLVGAGETALIDKNNLYTEPISDYTQFYGYMRYIHFKDQPLGDVVRFINENTESLKLKVAPQLEDKRFTVTFDNNTPDTMAMIICKYLNLEYNIKDNVIHITPPN